MLPGVDDVERGPAQKELENNHKEHPDDLLFGPDAFIGIGGSNAMTGC